MSKLTEEYIIDKMEELLGNLPSVSTPEIYVLKYNGNLISLPSGKSSWKKKHHATSAFTNANLAMVSGYRNGWSSSEVTKLLIRKGILEVVKIN